MRERLLDEIAREVGVDVIDIRRINMVRAEDQPTRMITGVSMTGVTIQECLEHAVGIAGLDSSGRRKRRAEGPLPRIAFLPSSRSLPGSPISPSRWARPDEETAWERVEPTAMCHPDWQSTTPGPRDHAGQWGPTRWAAAGTVRIDRGSRDNTPSTRCRRGSRSEPWVPARQEGDACGDAQVLRAQRRCRGQGRRHRIVDGPSVCGDTGQGGTIDDVSRLSGPPLVATPV